MNERIKYVGEDTRNAADRKKLGQQKKQDELRAEQEAADLRWILADERGRRFVRRLLEDCHEHRPSFHTNAAVMGFQEGERSIGLKLKARICALKPSDAVLGAVLLSGEESK